MKTILLFTLVILAVAISGCQDKKKVRNTNTQKETVKVETKVIRTPLSCPIAEIFTSSLTKDTKPRKKLLQP